MKFFALTFAATLACFAWFLPAHEALAQTIAGTTTGSPTASSGTTSSMITPVPTPMMEVVNVDLARYAGTWYEQARLPNRFQKNCTGQVSATYGVRADGNLDVANRCAWADGSIERAEGVGRRVAVSGRPDAGRLQVRFAPQWLGWLPMVWGDYWILQLDANYEVSLVGTPDHKYLWVLSRAPRLDDARLQAALDYARGAGFAVDEVVRTPATPALDAAR